MTSIIPATALTCDGCGEPSRGTKRMLTCSHCQQGCYHDATCQRLHYPKHQADCRKTVARLKATAEMPVLDGVRVVQSSNGLGKVLVATRDFFSLETVLLEPPALVFDHEDLFFSVFDGFVEAAPETRADILEMHDTYSAQAATATSTSTPATDMAAEMEQMRRDMMLESEFRRYSLEKPLLAKQIAEAGVTEKLMRIIDLNAHSFQEEPTGDILASVNVNGNGTSSDDEKGAIFVLGSKAEHSCAPNLRFDTGTNGMLRYVATVPISRGDRLSISYTKSVLQTPRLDRREFLLENKSFVCECVRCLGMDECNPLHCENCQDGLLLNAGRDDKWCCTSKACGWNANAVEGDGISRQLESIDNLANDIGFLRDSLRYGIDESTLPQAVKYQETVSEQCHPLHWLHIAAWDLGSIVSSSVAQCLMMEGHSPRSSRVVSLLQLSATFQIHQLLWTERNSAIVYGTLELTDAVALAASGNTIITPHARRGDSDDTAELCRLVEQVCDPKQRAMSPDSCPDVLQTVFHAGQDLLLAGHNDLAVKLYTVYKDGFRASPWTLSDAANKNFRDLIESGGRNNSFRNHLLAD